MHLPTQQLSQRRYITPIGHMRYVNASCCLEQLAGQMGNASDAGRCHADLTWIGLRVSNELGDCCRWNRWIDNQDGRLADDRGNGRNIADKIEIELFIKCCVDRCRRADLKERVAVRGGAFTAASVAILVPAPGRFSTMKGWPSRSHS